MVSSPERSGVKRRGKWLVVLGLIVLTVLGLIYWQWRAPRPNIILVTFDTTRADRLGVYGYEQGLTDAFDDFARSGVLFERAYAPAPITLPSHATLLTGLYPPEHGLRVNGAGKLTQDIPYLPEILKQHGYDTGAFIAAPVLDSQYGLDRGFDEYDDDFSSSSESHGEPRRDGRIVIDSALQWLRQRTEKPFFCWIHLYDAHGPYDPRVAVYQQRFESNPYDGGVAWEVQQFGRIRSYLEERGLTSETLVVVAGDHGEGLNEHQEDEHGMLVYETTLRVPFVFAGPEEYCRPGIRVPPAVSLVDLMPTMLDLLRISEPDHLSGRSLLPALKGQPLEERDCYAEAESPFVLNGWSPLQTVISGHWKYIQSTRPELYNLETDPGELSDMAGPDSEESDQFRGRLEVLQKMMRVATAEKVNLSDKDLENLRTLGYVGAGHEQSDSDSRDSGVLPDVKDFLPYLSRYEKAKHLVLESRKTQSVAEMNQAILLLKEIVLATDDFPMASSLLGDCFAQTGQHAEAERTYRALLSKRPNFLKVRFNLGKLLSEQGRFEEAAAEFRQYLSENPDSSTAYFELAEALIQRSQIEEAIRSYREAIRISPEFSMASLQLGRLLLQMNRTLEAQRCLESALEHDPQSIDLRSHLMMLFAQTGQNQKAIQQGIQLIKLDPNSFETRFNLGLLFVAQRQFADGLAQFFEARKLRPDDPRLLPQIQQAEAALKLMSQ